jgi:hypothetical protein
MFPLCYWGKTYDRCVIILLYLTPYFWNKIIFSQMKDLGASSTLLESTKLYRIFENMHSVTWPS